MNYLLIITTAIQAIKTVEAMMPASAGKDKAEAALAIIEGVVGEVQSIAPQLLALFTVVVNGLRSAGVFKTTATA